MFAKGTERAVQAGSLNAICGAIERSVGLKRPRAERISHPQCPVDRGLDAHGLRTARATPAIARAAKRRGPFVSIEALRPAGTCMCFSSAGAKQDPGCRARPLAELMPKVIDAVGRYGGTSWLTGFA